MVDLWPLKEARNNGDDLDHFGRLGPHQVLKDISQSRLGSEQRPPNDVLSAIYTLNIVPFSIHSFTTSISPSKAASTISVLLRFTSLTPNIDANAASASNFMSALDLLD